MSHICDQLASKMQPNTPRYTAYWQSTRLKTYSQLYSQRRLITLNPQHCNSIAGYSSTRGVFLSSPSLPITLFHLNIRLFSSFSLPSTLLCATTTPRQTPAQSKMSLRVVTRAQRRKALAEVSNLHFCLCLEQPLMSPTGSILDSHEGNLKEKCRCLLPHPYCCSPLKV